MNEEVASRNPLREGIVLEVASIAIDSVACRGGVTSLTCGVVNVPSGCRPGWVLTGTACGASRSRLEGSREGELRSASQQSGSVWLLDLASVRSGWEIWGSGGAVRYGLPRGSSRPCVISLASLVTRQPWLSWRAVLATGGRRRLASGWSSEPGMLPWPQLTFRLMRRARGRGYGATRRCFRRSETRRRQAIEDRSRFARAGGARGLRR